MSYLRLTVLRGPKDEDMEPVAISEDAIVRWSADAVATEVNDEVVLMNFEHNRCYGLGSTGSDIWRKLGTPIAVSALLLQLREEYEAPVGQIEADVRRTLEEFATEGLIEVTDSVG